MSAFKRVFLLLLPILIYVLILLIHLHAQQIIIDNAQNFLGRSRRTTTNSKENNNNKENSSGSEKDKSTQTRLWSIALHAVAFWMLCGWTVYKSTRLPVFSNSTESQQQTEHLEKGKDALPARSRLFVGLIILFTLIIPQGAVIALHFYYTVFLGGNPQTILSRELSLILFTSIFVMIYYLLFFVFSGIYCCVQCGWGIWKNGGWNATATSTNSELSLLCLPFSFCCNLGKTQRKKNSTTTCSRVIPWKSGLFFIIFLLTVFAFKGGSALFTGDGNDDNLVGKMMTDTEDPYRPEDQIFMYPRHPPLSRENHDVFWGGWTGVLGNYINTCQYLNKTRTAGKKLSSEGQKKKEDAYRMPWLFWSVMPYRLLNFFTGSEWCPAQQPLPLSISKTLSKMQDVRKGEILSSSKSKESSSESFFHLPAEMKPMLSFVDLPSQQMFVVPNCDVPQQGNHQKRNDHPISPVLTLYKFTATAHADIESWPLTDLWKESIGNTSKRYNRYHQLEFWGLIYKKWKAFHQMKKDVVGNAKRHVESHRESEEDLPAEEKLQILDYFERLSKTFEDPRKNNFESIQEVENVNQLLVLNFLQFPSVLRSLRFTFASFPPSKSKCIDAETIDAATTQGGGWIESVEMDLSLLPQTLGVFRQPLRDLLPQIKPRRKQQHEEHLRSGAIGGHFSRSTSSEERVLFFSPSKHLGSLSPASMRGGKLKRLVHPQKLQKQKNEAQEKEEEGQQQQYRYSPALESFLLQPSPSWLFKSLKNNDKRDEEYVVYRLPILSVLLTLECPSTSRASSSALVSGVNELHIYPLNAVARFNHLLHRLDTAQQPFTAAPNPRLNERGGTITQIEEEKIQQQQAQQMEQLKKIGFVEGNSNVEAAAATAGVGEQDGESERKSDGSHPLFEDRSTSLLILLIDCESRAGFLRDFPKTSEWLRQNALKSQEFYQSLKRESDADGAEEMKREGENGASRSYWLEFQGLTTVGYSTSENLVSLLTGFRGSTVTKYASGMTHADQKKEEIAKSVLFMNNSVFTLMKQKYYQRREKIRKQLLPEEHRAENSLNEGQKKKGKGEIEYSHRHEGYPPLEAFTSWMEGFCLTGDEEYQMSWMDQEHDGHWRGHAPNVEETFPELWESTKKWLKETKREQRHELLRTSENGTTPSFSFYPSVLAPPGCGPLGYSLDDSCSAPFCHQNYGPIFGNFQGPFSIQKRCLGRQYVHQHVLNYLLTWQQLLWKPHQEEEKNRNRRKLKQPRLPFLQSVTFIEAHEGAHSVAHLLDDDLLSFLQTLEVMGFFDSASVLIASDHGSHMGPYYEWFQAGRIERVMPFAVMSIPHSRMMKEAKRMSKIFTPDVGLSRLVKRLIQNSARLSTYRDIYETIKDLLQIGDRNDDDGSKAATLSKEYWQSLLVSSQKEDDGAEQKKQPKFWKMLKKHPIEYFSALSDDLPKRKSCWEANAEPDCVIHHCLPPQPGIPPQQTQVTKLKAFVKKGGEGDKKKNERE